MTHGNEMPSALQIQLSTLEDKVEYYSLFLLAIALAHLTRWGSFAFMATGSAIDELEGKSRIPPALWLTFAVAMVFIALFAWSFRQRALAMLLGLIVHVPTLLFSGVVTMVATKSMGRLPLPLLWDFALFLDVASAVGLVQGLRASYRYTLLLRSSQNQ